jgi:D-alanyl-lipoteichoic acid acyltransferase DltB (MBOAT superfamily)
MLPFVLLLIGVFFCVMISVRRFLARYQSPAQRSWWVRVCIFSFFGLVFLGILILPLPNKQRLLAIVPAFFLIAVASRVFRSGRARMQKESQKEPDIERLKRLN